MNTKNSTTAQAEDAPGIANPKIVCKSFTDVDGFKEFFAHRKTEIIQISPGSLQAEVLSMRVGDIYFVLNQVNQGV